MFQLITYEEMDFPFRELALIEACHSNSNHDPREVVRDWRYALHKNENEIIGFSIFVPFESAHTN